MAINAISTPQVYLASRNSAPVSNAAPESGSSTPAAGDSVTISTQPAPGPAPAPGPQPNPEVPTKKWTVMLWSAADNNLYRFLQSDIDEAETVGSTDQMNMLVQTDHAPKGGEAVRMKLETNSTPGVNSPVLQKMGDTNMGGAAELSDFIQWGIKNYPAENYMLILSDHGADWKGACQDQSKNGWMTLPTIEQGLKDAREKTGRKLDVVGFDACLMANTEVAHQLKDECSYLVGSEETEGGAGWQYNRVISKEMLASADSAMRTRLDFTPKEMATNVVTMARGNQGDLAAMTAIDTSKVQGITDAMKGFRDAIVASPVTSAALTATAGKTQKFYECRDLYDFADKVQQDHGSKDAKLAEAAKGVQNAINDAIVAEEHSTKYPGAHGLTIELNKQTGFAPQTSMVPNMSDEDASRVSFDKYSNTKFDQEVNWQAAINKIRG